MFLLCKLTASVLIRQVTLQAKSKAYAKARPKFMSRFAELKHPQLHWQNFVHRDGQIWKAIVLLAKRTVRMNKVTISSWCCMSDAHLIQETQRCTN